MSTKQNHTPGPWVVNGADGSLMVGMEEQAFFIKDNIGTGKEWIAVGINDREGFAEVVALCHPINAPLIAAAPELLAACQLFMQYDAENCQTGKISYDQVKHAISEAIARATS